MGIPRMILLVSYIRSTCTNLSWGIMNEINSLPIWYEAIVNQEAQMYLWVNPACISFLEDWTRQLIWWILTNGNPEKYHTIRWFSDYEKKAIQQLPHNEVQTFLSRYI